MNERIPSSSGLPLRAMVMVLLFLGVIFLLAGFQAMGSGGDADDDSATLNISTTATAAPTSSTPSKSTPSETPVSQAQVRVYNIGETEGAAARTGDQLRAAGWNVTETANLAIADPPLSTAVYFGTTQGEQAAAQEIGTLLDSPVQPRILDLADQPPGVIVLVTG